MHEAADKYVAASTIDPEAITESVIKGLDSQVFPTLEATQGQTNPGVNPGAY